MSKKSNKNFKYFDKVPVKKRKQGSPKLKFSFLFLIFSFLFSVSFLLYFGFKDINDNDNDKPNLGESSISYQDYYYDKIEILDVKDIYQREDDKFVSIGKVYPGMILNLEKDEYIEDGYFKIKNTIYYINYQNIQDSKSEEVLEKKTYLNYIPYNKNIKTTTKTNFYYDEKLILEINKGMELPILIQDNNFYGVLLDNELFYIKKDEVEVIKATNSSKYTSGIAVLTYHFTYDSNNLEEKEECLKSNSVICLSDQTFKKQLTYLKDNNFYTATMEDLEMFIDGKIQLPEKTVVITIDDGYFVDAAIKVLEELDLQATLFLIGRWFDPVDFESDNLELHSHTYGLHYAGACSGGQGSPLKCLEKEKLLEDLKKSREQLNGTTVFCYPFFEYNNYAIEVLKEAGFTMAFTGTRSKVEIGSNKYKLPRYGIISSTTLEQFKEIVN